jgi:hypothetical protein
MSSNIMERPPRRISPPEPWRSSETTWAFQASTSRHQENDEVHARRRHSAAYGPTCSIVGDDETYLATGSIDVL